MLRRRRIDPQSEEVDYSSEHFNPMRYLLEIHNSVPLQQLQTGLESVYLLGTMTSTMKGTMLDEESRLKKLVKDYFGDFVTARKTIEELESTLSDKTYFTEDGGLCMDAVFQSLLAYT